VRKSESSINPDRVRASPTAPKPRLGHREPVGDGLPVAVVRAASRTFRARFRIKPGVSADCLARAPGYNGANPSAEEVSDMAKDHGSSVKNDKQYEGLRKKGMSKSRAAAISNSQGASSRGGKKSGSGSASKSDSSQGGTTQQKKAAGRKGGKAASKS